ncbi:RmlC-like cupin domain-containing protein [Xylariaceae sp. FL0255]|nr:RmlC-like cupin domain-containing protein [Xylariaceae sp. FL0255]
MQFSAALLLAVGAAVYAAPTTATFPRSTNSTYYPLPPDVPANPRSQDMALIQALELAPTTKTRIPLLKQPGDFKFDFLNPPNASVVMGAGGHTVATDANIFPALIKNNAAMTLGFLDGCGFNTPHVHPRATELNVVVEGRLVSEMTVENGVSPVQNLLDKYQMTVFPQGAMHTEFNPDCEPAVFVAGFNNVDPGVQQTAQTFFGLRPDIVEAALGADMINGADIETFKDMIPPNVALGVESCLAKCGISKNAKRDLTA